MPAYEILAFGNCDEFNFALATGAVDADDDVDDEDDDVASPVLWGI